MTIPPKKHRFLAELVAKEETPGGGISITAVCAIMKDLSTLAKKHGFDCYAKGSPAKKLGHVPTGKKFEIKKLEDILELDEVQFEFFIDDLREWCRVMKTVKSMSDVGIPIERLDDGMIWLDTGLNESKITLETSNKL